MKTVHYPRRKEFFAKVKELITDDRSRTAIEVAYNLSKEVFRNKIRDDGERAFNHAKAVAWIIMNETNIRDQLRLTILIICALWHDVMEDTFAAQKKHIRFIFDQLNPDIAEVIADLTKQKDKRKKWLRLLRSMRIPTKIVKAADRLHNQRTLLGCAREKVIRKNQETRDVILPWLRAEPTNADILQLADKIEEQTTRNEAAVN